MTLGLVRHFKVIMPDKKFLYSSADFRNALDRYDIAGVKSRQVDMGPYKWDVCYSSTLPRAETTARSIYDGEIITSDLIREVPMEPFTDSGLILPSFLWHIGARVAWYKNKLTQPETRIQTLERIRLFRQEIEKHRDKNILIVTHGFFMKIFTAQLLKDGFSGKIDERPLNGKLYVFRR